MNVTELARRVNLPPNELYELLPQFGFDVGRRAIKMDDRLAQRFLRQWPRIRRELRRRQEHAKKEEERERRRSLVREGEAREIEVPAIISVRDFAALLSLPVSEVLQELLRNGILANLNEPIDFSTATIIAEDLGARAVPASGAAEEDTVKAQAPSATPRGTTTRPPVVVVMGHVDHGKTALLDRIRKTNVAAGEAGGITQHIGAYQTEVNDRAMTFIDTPGHQAFTTMRSRGARIADIAVLVVAADDGVQPQTKEALKIIQAASLPFVVAINKMDKEGANLERVKQELGALSVTAEDWGGKIPFVSVSALRGDGIEDLLEVILLVADVEEDRLKADPNGDVEAVAIESHVDKREGPMVSLLVQHGTLRVGDVLALGKIFGGTIRAMRDHRGEDIEEATPSTPVQILGFKLLPEVGEFVRTTTDRKSLTVSKKQKRSSGATKAKVVLPKSQAGEDDEAASSAVSLPIIIRADVLGSLEAFANELENVGEEGAVVKVVSRGLGNITENDVSQAEATGAYIFGFGVHAPVTVQELARESGVTLSTHQVIYELLTQVRSALEAILPTETVRTDLGTIRVLALFKATEKWQVVGGKVTKGLIAMSESVVVELVREGAVVSEGTLIGLQVGKEEVREIAEGSECGLKISGMFEEIQEGDTLNFHKEVTTKKVLV
jgi:translation initiation factor IF-2